jgi:hypothetical protein
VREVAELEIAVVRLGVVGLWQPGGSVKLEVTGPVLGVIAVAVIKVFATGLH